MRNQKDKEEYLPMSRADPALRAIAREKIGEVTRAIIENATRPLELIEISPSVKDVWPFVMIREYVFGGEMSEKKEKLEFTPEELISEVLRILGKNENDILLLRPLFEEKGFSVIYIPKTVEEYDFLKTLGQKDLQILGLLYWGRLTTEDEKDKKNKLIYTRGEPITESGHLWLFPKEWYSHIPEGYEIIDILERKHKFQYGETSNDDRFGALAYGIYAAAFKGKEYIKTKIRDGDF